MNFVIKHGPIFNIVHSLIKQEGCFNDEDDYFDEITTCCYETTELLKDLFSNSHQIPFDINQESLLIVEINDVAEIGSHYIGIIGSYVIQSFGFRYSYILSEYNSVEEILLYLQRMFDTTDPLLKIAMYNKFTHNQVTLTEYNKMLDPRYERNQSLNIEAYRLIMPSRKRLLEYLNHGLHIAIKMGFLNIANDIRKVIDEL